MLCLNETKVKYSHCSYMTVLAYLSDSNWFDLMSELSLKINTFIESNDSISSWRKACVFNTLEMAFGICKEEFQEEVKKRENIAPLPGVQILVCSRSGVIV